MRKVLIVMNNLAGGGAEKVLINLLSILDKKKYEITLVLLERDGIYLKNLDDIGGVKYRSIFNKIDDNTKFYYLKKIIKKLTKGIVCNYPSLVLKKLEIEEYYDVGISFLEGPSTLFVSKLKNCKKMIAWVHSDLEKHRVLNKMIEGKAYLKFDKIICVSEDAKKAMENLYPKCRKSLKVIYNPVDKAEILKKSLEKKEISYDNSKINVVTIGRLTHVKGYDILLKAHNRLLKEGLDYNLYILGEGEERKNLENYIKKTGVSKNTFLLGFKKNPYPYIKDADFFVSTSRYEGYSLVVAEALCLEKPVIATKCTGPIELLENGKYGLLLEVEDINELTLKIKELILNKDLREKYSILAKKRANIFDLTKTIEEIEKILNY